MSKDTTSVQIDFTGEELVQIGKACITLNMTFNEFIDRALIEAVKKATEVVDSHKETF